MTLPAIVLASGGLDSTACLAYYLGQRRPVQALWVDYGQRAARREVAAIKRITGHYRIPLHTIKVDGIQWPTLGGELFEFRGRNLTLAAIALNTAPRDGALVALGIHRGTPFADCESTFVQKLDDLLTILSDGLVRLDCPFVDWSKEEVGLYANAQRVPFDLTYSCERGTLPPCGECVKCRDNQALAALISSASAEAEPRR